MSESPFLLTKLLLTVTPSPGHQDTGQEGLIILFSKPLLMVHPSSSYSLRDKEPYPSPILQALSRPGNRGFYHSFTPILFLPASS